MPAPRARRFPAALAALTLAACVNQADPSRFDEYIAHTANFTPREDRYLAERYRDWVRLEYLGPSEAPVDTLWLATAPLTRDAPLNQVLVLTPQAFATARLRLATLPCPPPTPPSYHAVTLTVATEGRINRRCFAGRPTVCDVADVLWNLTNSDLVSGALDARLMLARVCETGFAA